MLDASTATLADYINAPATDTGAEQATNTTAPATTAAPAAAAAPQVTAATMARAESQGISAEEFAKAQDILSDAEFSDFVSKLEGDDDLNTDVLKTIATKIGKTTHQAVAKTSRKVDAVSAKMAEMQATIDAMAAREAERVAAETAAKAAAESAKKEDANATQFQKLSTASTAVGVDLEASLADPAIKALLQTGDYGDGAITNVQAVTSFIAKGNYAKAAEIIKAVVAAAGGKVNEPVVQPSTTTATGAKAAESTYQDEMAAVMHTYGMSAKTFADQKAKVEAVAALKAKFGFV